MPQMNASNISSFDPKSNEPFDDLFNLYIGHVSEAKGQVFIGEWVDVWLRGEILLYGVFHEGKFVVERLRRIAFYGASTKFTTDDPIGVLSLWGPTVPVEFAPISEGEINKEMPLNLHSAELSTARPGTPYLRDGDAFFPVLASTSGIFTIISNEGKEGQTVELLFSWRTTDISSDILISIKEIWLEDIRVSLVPVGKPSLARLNQPLSEGALPQAAALQLLQANACPPPPPCAVLDNFTRKLPLRLINLSNKKDAQGNLLDITALCQTQLDNVCAVWRNKAALALDLTLTAEIVQGDSNQRITYSRFRPPKLTGLLKEPNLSSPTEVDIYVVDELFDENGNIDLGGGMSHDCGVVSTFTILARHVMEGDPADPQSYPGNPFLLAHELGHVLGLNHNPAESAGPAPVGATFPASAQSIMTPTGGPANLNINTLFNCRIFTAGANGRSYNPIVADLPDKDCFRPDRNV